MVMMDDNSATMVAAVKEGRMVFENIKGKKACRDAGVGVTFFNVICSNYNILPP
jgi:hypothetical protein